MNRVLDEILAYVELDAADRARLQALHAVLAPAFPAIADRFYVAVFANPGAAAILDGPAQIERLRVSLVDWMATGLRGPYDAAFYEKRSRIGRRHVEIGLAQHYMFTSTTVIRGEYLARIGALYPAAEALRVIGSVDKLFDLELALMLRHYQLDSEERLVARERRIQGDQALALQTLTAGLAHEVRNPLNAAKLQLELVSRRLRRMEAADTLVGPTDLAHHEIERLASLLDEFLAFARSPQLARVELDLAELARDVVELEAPLAQQSGATLVLVAPVGPTRARVDRGKLHQVIQNLVRNAIEASPAGRVTLTVSATEASVSIHVADDGPGIPEAVRRRIFEPFFTTKESGTGMGMAIVHNLVSAHGGVVDIATGPQGTTIDVTVPRWHGP